MNISILTWERSNKFAQDEYGLCINSGVRIRPILPKEPDNFGAVQGGQFINSALINSPNHKTFSEIFDQDLSYSLILLKLVNFFCDTS